MPSLDERKRQKQRRRSFTDEKPRLLRERVALRFVFIDEEKAHYRIRILCSALKVSRAGYYASLRRPPSLHSQEDVRLAVLIRTAHERSRRTYGSPRVHAELQAQGYRDELQARRAADARRRAARSNAQALSLHHDERPRPWPPICSTGASKRRSCSMSRRGNAYDNGAMESWFSTMTFELGDRFDTHADAKAKLFEYIDVFYNQASFLSCTNPATWGDRLL